MIGIQLYNILKVAVFCASISKESSKRNSYDNDILVQYMYLTYY